MNVAGLELCACAVGEKHCVRCVFDDGSISRAWTYECIGNLFHFLIGDQFGMSFFLDSVVIPSLVFCAFRAYVVLSS
jgi:hypothetical protein